MTKLALSVAVGMAGLSALQAGPTGLSQTVDLPLGVVLALALLPLHEISKVLREPLKRYTSKHNNGNNGGNKQ